MFYKNPWETALQEIMATGEANKLNPISLEILKRLSDKANPVTGICILDIEAFSKEVNREGPLLHADLSDLTKSGFIKKQICLELAVITLHDRFKEKVAWAR